MNILKKKILKNFLNYKLWLIILIFVIIQSTLGHDMDKTIKARQPDFVYNDSKEFLSTLKSCIKWIEKDTNVYQNVPHEITIAQAVIESDYGTSRFSNEANNLFGVRTYDLSLPHIKPLNNPQSKFGLKKYKTKCDSVADYIKILNNGFAFEEFRELRFKMIKNDNLDVLILVETLSRYASNPNYVKLVKKTIKSLRNERISTTN
tara:strand:- start:781 stop:1395 length:615 start_codon:yes stop_codon:yes gene_type:complete